jgi:hypothetical protein
MQNVAEGVEAKRAEISSRMQRMPSNFGRPAQGELL